MIEKINEWLDTTIKTKKSQADEIRELKNKIDELKANEQYAIEQMNKYKKKCRELRKNGQSVSKNK